VGERTAGMVGVAYAVRTAGNGGSGLLIFVRPVASDRDSDYAGHPVMTSSHVAVPPLGKPVAAVPLSGNRYPMTFRLLTSSRGTVVSPPIWVS
jgi:hypothetical protein